MTLYDSDHYITGLPYKFAARTAARLDGIQALKRGGGEMRDGKNKIMIAVHEQQIGEQLRVETATADVMRAALLCKRAFFAGKA